jgi:hypothetical protein
MWVINCGSLDVMCNLDKGDPVTYLLSKSSLAAKLRVNQEASTIFRCLNRFSASLAKMAWRVLRYQLEEMTYRYGS